MVIFFVDTASGVFIISETDFSLEIVTGYITPGFEFEQIIREAFAILKSFSDENPIGSMGLQ